MQYRHYHMKLDVPPSWGQITGFGMSTRQLDWVQSATWWQMIMASFGGVLTVNGAPALFPPGSMLVIPPSARCTIERTTSDNITQHWLKFRPDDTGELVSAVPQVFPFERNFDHFQDQFRECIDFMPFSRAKLNAMTWHLLWYVAENAAVVPEDPGLGLVEATIRERLAENLSISELAEEAGMSVAKLTMLFRDQHDQTPADYIKTLRMQLACIQLIKTNKPIKEIASRVGYPNLQRFNKVVRETFGCSPRSLRQDRPIQKVHVDLSNEEYQAEIASLADPVRPVD